MSVVLEELVNLHASSRELLEREVSNMLAKES
jgi:hypothetical protein